MNPKLMQARPRTVRDAEKPAPGPFNGKHLFVLDTFEHPQGHKYVLGTMVDRDTGATLKTYYDAIQRHTQVLLNADKFASEVQKAGRKPGHEREESLNDIKYGFVNRHGASRDDSQVWLDLLDKNKPELLIVPGDFKAPRGTLVSKKPAFVWQPEPGDVEYVANLCKKIGKRKAEEMQGATKAIKAAIMKEEAAKRTS